MTIKDITGNELREKIFPDIIEEACRQWYAFIEDSPERQDGEGFSDFFFEIFKEKEVEYAYQLYNKEQCSMKNKKEEKTEILDRKK